MLEIYRLFFSGLTERHEEIRIRLQDELPVFERLLRNQPSFPWRKVLVVGDRDRKTLRPGQTWLRHIAADYEEYLRRVLAGGLRLPVRAAFEEFLARERMIRRTGQGDVVVLRPRPTAVEIDLHEARHMYEGLRESQKLADRLAAGREPVEIRLEGLSRSAPPAPAPPAPAAQGPPPPPPPSSPGGFGGEPPDAPEPSGPSRQIVMTAHDSRGDRVTSFKATTPYTLRCHVGQAAAGNLVRGDIDITNVPKGGLRSRWVISSSTAEFITISRGACRKCGDTWIAEFLLDIPERDDSDRIDLLIRTTTVSADLTVAIFVQGEGRQDYESYRTCSVRLAIDTPDADVQTSADIVAVAPAHLHLHRLHEWTTPREHLEINVFGEAARITTVRGDNDYGTVDWCANGTELKNPIQTVRAALDRFRTSFETYLNAIDPQDLDKRLAGDSWLSPVSGADWTTMFPNCADKAHRDAFEQVLASDELWELASEGYSLFNACFPEGNELRRILGTLTPGSRIDFVWPSRGAADWVSHVPWALMYMALPRNGVKPDCTQFLGLRFRLGSRSWEPKAPSRALGTPTATHALNFLYWGDEPNDDVGVQAAWQRQAFAGLQQRAGLRFLPAVDTAAADRKQEILKALEAPTPDPAGILYFFCHCSVRDGSEPVLQFGDDGSKPNVVRKVEMPQGPLASSPLVFANACGTAAADPQATSELEAAFFRRNIRAFIGTEAKVPVELASRVAWLYFNFFLRFADPDHRPMAAGEALAQTRLFLWNQYRNIGGLFYCFVNQYDLYFASTEEVSSMQRTLPHASRD